ncbi:MAG TPA: serine hydrolase domain-containing protein, partial [Candidatus Limnocylindrales bacterium]|nr:serine hydrolase domain-containing protein [Candidatus Limnocylindrales bacterium]
MNFQTVENAFNEAVAQGVFPGAVVLVCKDEQIVFEKAFGYRSLLPQKSPMQIDTIFDLASLTKPMATTVGIMLLVREKKLRTDDKLTRIVPMFGVFGKSAT